MSERLEQLISTAIQWADDGIPVFPCGKGKAPLTKNGFKDASTDPTVIRETFEFFGDSAHLIGGKMGDGLFAVDVDLYKGSEPEAWYKTHVDDGSLVDTRTHQTMNGGLHLLYEGEVRSCVPASGVEIKGEGGYIVLPAEGTGYKVLKEGMVHATASLLESIRYTVAQSSNSTLDMLKAKVLDGSDFHNALTQIAAKLAMAGKDQMGIQKELRSMMEASTASYSGHDRHTRWRKIMEDTGGEFSRIASTAYVKFNTEAVADAFEEMADMTEINQLSDQLFTQLGEEPEKPKQVVYDEDQWPFEGTGYFADKEHNLVDHNFTMYPIYSENETVVLFAEPKTGKTALALTTALHIACGMDLGALKVAEAGSCLYYALEGSHAIRLRIKSWRKVMEEKGEKLPERIPMYVVEKTTNFMKEESRRAEADKLIAAYKYGERHGKPLKVIFLDTLTKAMSGSDQNSVEDTSALFEIVGMCRDAGVTSTIVFVHHKSRQGNLRGSSNIEAEPDMLLDVSKKGEIIAMKVAKARSIEDGFSYHFAISDVDLGLTKQGHPLHGMFVEALEQGDVQDRQEGNEDPQEILKISQRRKAATQLGESPEGGAIMEAWFKLGLIAGKSQRGTMVAPSFSTAKSQQALYETVPDVGGTVYGDAVMRLRYEGNLIVGYSVKVI